MTSRGQCPRGGACGYLCKISGKSTPLPPLTKAFPYAYAAYHIGLGPRAVATGGRGGAEPPLEKFEPPLAGL